MIPALEGVERSVPGDWTIVSEDDGYVSVTHAERDVSVTVERFEVTGGEVRSRAAAAPERTVFEVGYRPPDVGAKSLHVSTVSSAETAERLVLDAIRMLDE